MRVDLNADVGEGSEPLGQPPSAILESLTSANVACGVHAGDPSMMRATVCMAREYGVAVGAHPGFADRATFGREETRAAPQEIEDLVTYQIGALRAIAAAHGVPLAHVKPHGALYNMAARDATIARDRKSVV